MSWTERVEPFGPQGGAIRATRVVFTEEDRLKLTTCGTIPRFRQMNELDLLRLARVLEEQRRFGLVMLVAFVTAVLFILGMGMAYRATIGEHHDEFKRFRDSQLEFNAAQADFNIAVSKELENAKP